VIGHPAEFVFENSASHVVKLGVGVTASGEAPPVYSSETSVGVGGVERVDEQSGD
jgi:hypothetical protein